MISAGHSFSLACHLAPLLYEGGVHRGESGTVLGRGSGGRGAGLTERSGDCGLSRQAAWRR